MDDIFGSYLASMGAGTGGAPSEDLFHDYLQTLTAPRPAASHPESAPAAAVAMAEASAPALVPAASTDSQYDLAITGGRLVIPEFGVMDGEVYVRDGKIASIGAAGAGLPAKQTVDARGRHVLPGIIDPHIHLGLFHPLHHELEAETAAALIGGVTTAGWFMAAPLSQMGVFEEVADQVQSLSHINILPHFIINNPEQLPQIPRLINEYGVRSFKVYMHGVPGLINSSGDAFILAVMRALKKSGKDCLLCVHSENHSLVEDASQRVTDQKGGAATLQDWAETHPELAEEEAIQRMAFFAQKLEQRVYVVHVSSKGGAEMLRRVKQGNPYIFGETTSPYLTTTMEECGDFRGKMEPPLRTHADQNALWKALLDDTISTIGTDNVTVPDGVKRGSGGMLDVMSGYAVTETHLPSLLTEGVLHRGVPIQKLVAKMTMAPAKMFGLYPHKGSLMPGCDADITLVDLERYREVRAHELHSLSGYSIFEGRMLAGFASMTIQAGHIAAADGEVVAGPYGKLTI